jgi:predicted small lipoprotein YifL
LKRNKVKLWQYLIYQEDKLKNKFLNLFIIILLFIMSLTGCGNAEEYTPSNNKPQEIKSEESEERNDAEEEKTEESSDEETSENDEGSLIDEDGRYTDPYEVAEYIFTYNKLPVNYITKKEAAEAGWESDEGNLWEVTDEMSIGGDYFGNREGKLPKKDGRKWFECDVNYSGGYRGEERIVYSNDGLIYYTDDHYETFTRLY